MEFSLASNSQQSSCLSFSVVITGISFHSLLSGKLSLIFPTFFVGEYWKIAYSSYMVFAS